MQTLGRFAIIGGTVIVALINVVIFSSVEAETEQEKIILYGNIYLFRIDHSDHISIRGIAFNLFKRKKTINFQSWE